MAPLPVDVWRFARDVVADRLGLDIPERRQPDLEWAMACVAGSNSTSAVMALLAHLNSARGPDPRLVRLAGALTIGETHFFRDAGCFGALEEHVLPTLITSRRRSGNLRLRLWSAGCSTGEEAYSLAMLVDRLVPDRQDWAITVLATDVNADALEAARRGRYRAWSVREVPDWARQRYLPAHSGGSFEVVGSIRDLVRFEWRNLVEEPAPGEADLAAMDLILCRNVLMYLTRDAQKATAGRLARALAPDGWLAVAPAEASSNLFSPLAAMFFPGAILHRRVPTEYASSAAELEQPVTEWPRAIAATGEALRLAVVPAKRISPSSTLLPPGRSTGPIPAAALPSSATMKQADAPTSPPAVQEGGGLASALSTDGLERLRSLADDGQLGDARREGELLVIRYPLEAELWRLLGAICQEQGDVSRAREALGRAIYLDPTSASAHFSLGTLLVREGEPDLARRHLQTVVRIIANAPTGQIVDGVEGLTAGRVRDLAWGYLKAPPLRAGARTDALTPTLSQRERGKQAPDRGAQ